MKGIFLLLSLFVFTGFSFAQTENTNNLYDNSAERLLKSDGNLTIGGYAEVHYNQPMGNNPKSNATLDVHRVVMLLGYKFNERTQFISEIEYEHVSEVYIEQAFLQYKLSKGINLRAGLLLAPMGLINEYHEPNTFNGVERPFIDAYIAPTTWREIGIGLSGTYLPANIRYQAYVMNGFNGYDGAAKFSGKNGLRKGRQKGAESYMSSPNLALKLEYFGIKNFNIGLSGYFGKSQSVLYDEVDDAVADSSVVDIAMIGADFRYANSGWQLKGQLYYNSLGNTKEYNEFTSDGLVLNDLGKSMIGYYVELGYNLFKSNNNITDELIPFVRYEGYDTQNTVEDGVVRSKSNAATIITSGLTWKITPKVAFKSDVQFVKKKSDDKSVATFNAGFGLMF
ncbi:hypothetical protein [Plebeiibacterium sediminum]|uniref:Porin n=1 Tax=Plebeiibacterium sediminum TaxID=2992112 RepID=A0AAE3M7M3_9BACT|nr:hypothetical protein [Plebeiobacterium sediminum]MCW3788035.1 hypothetical protein [Plebeiobacterium sediminum]